MIRVLVFLALIACAHARIVSFTSVGYGSNITTAFLDRQSRVSPYVMERIAQRMGFHDVLPYFPYNISLDDCVANAETGVETCSEGNLRYSYYINHKTTEDTTNPERLGSWEAEEYGAAIIPAAENLIIVTLSFVIYYNPNNISEYEAFHTFTSTFYDDDPVKDRFRLERMWIIVTGDMRSYCGMANYTLSDNKWLVNTTYKSECEPSEVEGLFPTNIYTYLLDLASRNQPGVSRIRL